MIWIWRHEDTIPCLIAIGVSVRIAYVFTTGFGRQSPGGSRASVPAHSEPSNQRRNSGENGQGRRQRSSSSRDDANGYNSSDDEWELPGQSLSQRQTPATPPQLVSRFGNQAFASPVWQAPKEVVRGLDTPETVANVARRERVLRRGDTPHHMSKRNRLALARLNARRAYEAGELDK